MLYRKHVMQKICTTAMYCSRITIRLSLKQKTIAQLIDPSRAKAMMLDARWYLLTSKLVNV